MEKLPQTRNFLYLALLVAFLLICFLILASVEQVVRSETIKQYTSYQELQSEQAATAIESFFQYHLNSLNSLASIHEVARLDSTGEELLHSYYNANDAEVQAVTRVDQNGIIIYTAPEKPGMVGTDINYQEHIQKILVDHQVIVSDIFLSAQGYETVAMHVPVFENGEFLGTLAVLIPFDQLASNNLAKLNASGSQVWLLSQSGIELFSPSPAHVGLSINDVHKDSPDFVNLISTALRSETGSGSFEAFPSDTETLLPPDTLMHASYSMVHVPNSSWTIVIAAPEDTVLATMEGFRNRWLAVISVLLFGTILLALLIIRENSRNAKVAQRIQDSIEIRELKEFNENVIHSMAEGLMVLDPEYHVTTINPSGEAILGVKAEQLVGKSVRSLLREDQLEILVEIRAIQDQGKSSHNELTYQKPSGELIALNVAVSPIYQDHKLTGTTVVFYDNTAEKKAALALHESEMRYHNIFEGVQDAIFVIHLDGTISDANLQACQLYGREKELLIGKNINELAVPGSSRLTDDPTSGQLSAIHVHHDGSLFPVEISRSIQKFEPDTFMLVVVRDVSSRVEREKELEAILGVAAALRTPVTVEETLQALLYQVIHMFHFEGALVALRSTNNDDLEVPLGMGTWSEITGERLAESASMSSEVLKTGMPYINNGPIKDIKGAKKIHGHRSTAIACLPLITQQRTIGAMWVGSNTPIGEKEIRLLTAISNIAANGLHRARLHEETQRRVQRLAALRNIDITITASLDLRLTLDILLGQVISHLNVDAACVLLFNPNLQVLEFSTGNGFRTNAINRSRLRLGEDLAGAAALNRKIVNLPDLSKDQTQSKRMKLLEAENFVSYFAVPLIAKGGIKGVLEVFNRTQLNPDPEWLDFLEAIAAQAAIAIDNARLFDDLQRSNMELTLAYDATLEGWVHALDMRDKETEGHTQRVTSATLQLARLMNIPETEMINIRRGALLHDIGKVAIPDRILRKTGPLDPEEREEIKMHPTYAYELLSPISYLRPALDIPYCHHEKWDGTGYPRGLKSEQIPLVARVFAVIDVWDALRSNRPYREAWPDDKVIEYLRAETGKHFDPKIMDAFLKLVPRLNSQ